MLRDFQRTRVYRSEWEMLDNREVWYDLSTCWHFITDVARKKQFVKHFPETFTILGGNRWPSKGPVSPDEHRPNGRLIYLHYGDRRSGLKVKPGYRRVYAEAWNSTMILPIWSRNDLTILHELAHVCNFYEMKPVPAHGKEFVDVYLRLVTMTLGKETAADLQNWMTHHRVQRLG